MSKNNARDKELMKQSETECGFDSDKFADLIRADEREACAKVCEMVDENDLYFGSQYAEAIRARGNT
jgi:hypothetical protein